ncbi:alkaline phosphatase [Microbulbifer sp. CAU 1566]|uniref:alkaline phosphatase n=1 Tax=Microbulbifer sp. CAU 1566 TaxID=2933269 RepID=UPI00200622FB|nr:alkaline phosphatase [Microbulbifer sp. CAU 1566]MCK7596577.1 alkaline phosphatase [Microbulbifer sp. CAU 1566]
MKLKTLPLVPCLLLGLASQALSTQTLSTQTPFTQSQPRNIIFMIGDGMGPAYTSGYRYFKDDPRTPAVDTTVFDRLLVGTASTYPDDDTYVTDSAASATALATGVKSYNGAIGIDAAHKPLESLLKRAKQLGKDTALVVTSELNHATPASFVAHNESRGNKDDIANDFIDIRINQRPVVDLLLGGGQQYFQRQDRNILQEFERLDYQSAIEFDALNSLTRLPAIGLFASKGLERAIDSANPHRLSVLTGHALNLLQNNRNPAGFFMMIEGSQIDWCGHANDIACAMHEMDDFAHSIELVEKFIENNPDTLLVVTADHSTGGLSLAANKRYIWNTDIVAQQKQSLGKFTEQLDKDTDIAARWSQNFGYTLEPQDQERLRKALDKSQEDEHNLYDTVVEISSRYSNTGWTTRGHDAVDVQVFAAGKGHDRFRGFQDNTDISKTLFELLGSKSG